MDFVVMTDDNDEEKYILAFGYSGNVTIGSW
jgi:hypothetical protein